VPIFEPDPRQVWLQELVGTVSELCRRPRGVSRAARIEYFLAGRRSGWLRPLPSQEGAFPLPAPLDLSPQISDAASGGQLGFRGTPAELAQHTEPNRLIGSGSKSRPDSESSSDLFIHFAGGRDRVPVAAVGVEGLSCRHTRRGVGDVGIEGPAGIGGDSAAFGV
jgi:hypothetical protein